MELKYKGITYKTGDYVYFSIQDSKMDGRIYVDGVCYICHNNDRYDGSRGPDMFGYRNSWSFRVVDGVPTESVELISKIDLSGWSKTNAVFDDKITEFFNLTGDTHYQLYLEYDLKFLNGFNSFRISETEGFITLEKLGKKMDIKFGRFLRQLLSEISEKIGSQFDDKYIESYHNKFMSFVKNDQFVIEFLSGNDIDCGYASENYLQGSSISKSCMNNKFDFLKIYKENPNSVQLMTLKVFGRIASRALVWTDVDGSRIMDRIYYSKDWLHNIMVDKSKEFGFKYFYDMSDADVKNAKIKLDKWNFDHYPYLDSFYYLCDGTGHLKTSLKSEDKNIYSLRQTSGERVKQR